MANEWNGEGKPQRFLPPYYIRPLRKKRQPTPIPKRLRSIWLRVCLVYLCSRAFGVFAFILVLACGHMVAITNSAVKYTGETVKALSDDLFDILYDNQVPADIVEWLVPKGITKVAAFTDLADTKAQIVPVIIRAAGDEIELNEEDAVATQPLKSAWRASEAVTKAENEALARGEDPDRDATLGAEARKRLDESVTEHFKFMWPPAWQPQNSLVGKLQRFFRRKTDFVPRLECDVEAITDRGTDISSLLSDVAKGKPVTSDISSVFNIIRERHLQMTIGYNIAAAPDLDAAPFPMLLDYHQWVVQRGSDAGSTKEVARELLSADLSMRTRWMLSWKLNEFVCGSAATSPGPLCVSVQQHLQEQDIFRRQCWQRTVSVQATQ